MSAKSSKTALITGITGQDGGILSELLLSKGYDVHGIRPYSATPDLERVNHIDGLQCHYGDLTDTSNLLRIIETIKPDEIYNLGALTHVHVSFDMPEVTANINALGTLRLLEAIRLLGAEKNIRFYQASSSEIFGSSPAPQNEDTPFAPCSPYGVSKMAAYWYTRNYRDAYGMFAANGILFNHESPLRGEEFVTRKIVKAIAAIKKEEQDVLKLGNLNAQRDWGHARDYMDAIWRILQHDTADDFVIATGETHSVREFVESACQHAEINIEWQGNDKEEKAIDTKTGKIIVEIDPDLYRPNEVNCLQGDYSKAKNILRWSPQTSFDELVREMMHAEL